MRPEGSLEIGWTFLAHAFSTVDEVVFVVHSGNVRSQRAVERLGAVRVGTEPDPDGRGDNVLFRLARPATP